MTHNTSCSVIPLVKRFRLYTLISESAEVPNPMFGIPQPESIAKQKDNKKAVLDKRIFTSPPTPANTATILACQEEPIRCAGGFGEFGLCETKPNRSLAFRTRRPFPSWEGRRGGSIWRSRSQSKFTKPDGAPYTSLIAIEYNSNGESGLA